MIMARTSYVTRTAVLHGVEALPVTVEVSITSGLPGISIVGMPDSAVLEARARVRCALRQCGFELPRSTITVNLAPSDLRKTGTGFDLPIAVAILACTGQIPTRDLDGCLFVGELTLEADVRPVRGLVAYSMLAASQGLVFVGPHGTLSWSDGQALVIGSLAQLLQGVKSLKPPSDADHMSMPAFRENDHRLDFADVIDQEIAKRAFVIAAAGEHGLLMVGPPGAGKSMMAKRMPTILSPLSNEERAETLLIHSVAGQELDDIACGHRPFRAPHHAMSRGGLVGGGRPVMPGEVSLAHNGVLFLDELPEFGPGTLQLLRQPIEEKEVRLVRVDGTYVFPCDFLLVAAANPCPCGYLGDPDHQCSCSAVRIQSYQARIGGPLMDRIEMHVDVMRPASERIISGEEGTSSESMAGQVEVARAFASWRRSHDDETRPDRMRRVQELGLDAEACRMLEQTARRLGLGGRGIVRIACVARTIADIAESDHVTQDHVVEACAFRTRATL